MIVYRRRQTPVAARAVFPLTEATVARISRAALLATISVASITVVACRIELGAPERAPRGTGGPSGSVLIYTSMYRPVIDSLTALFESKLPAIKVEWLQSGSEKIATRIDAELAAGESPADIVMTSDPFWYERKKREGAFRPYASIRALSIPRELVDKSGAFVTSRLSVMVLAYNERLVKADEAPSSFEDLFSPRFAKRITIADPLSSGTTFSTLAFIADAHGPEIIDRMKASGTIASGGNSAAFARLESGEQQVGFVLLENVLEGRRNGSPIAFRLPAEGAILIPGPIAILKTSHNPIAAEAVYDLLLSPDAQALIVKGDLHSPFEDIAPPQGAPPLDALMKSRFQWAPDFVERAINGQDELKRRFARVMGGR
jgi:iron(III) transport system substrate-binding protein